LPKGPSPTFCRPLNLVSGTVGSHNTREGREAPVPAPGKSSVTIRDRANAGQEAGTSQSDHSGHPALALVLPAFRPWHLNSFIPAENPPLAWILRNPNSPFLRTILKLITTSLLNVLMSYCEVSLFHCNGWFVHGLDLGSLTRTLTAHNQLTISETLSSVFIASA
jgi:hypothetical protein